MIYSDGTTNIVSGSAIVRGTGTQWKSNINGIAAGQIISIQSGNTVIQNVIRSVNSDTELVLAFAPLVSLNNANYVISTTVPDTVSDGVRHICAINAYIILFLQNMDRWMSESGKVEVEMPNGQKVTLDSIRALQAGVEGKLVKEQNGADIPNKPEFVKNLGLAGTAELAANAVSANGGNYSGYFRFKQVETLPTERNAVMLVSSEHRPANGQVAFTSYGWYDNYVHTGIVRGGGTDSPGYAVDINSQRALTVNAGGIIINSQSWGGISVFRPSGTHWRLEGNLDSDEYPASFIDRNPDGSNRTVQYFPKGSGTLLVLGGNCWRDGNGFIKQGSPIIQIHPEGQFETNDESEGATVTKLGLGHYKLSGILGYNSDGAWGVHGGISVPRDVNGNELVYVEDKVLPDGAIEIKVTHRQNAHMPARLQNRRMKSVDEPTYYTDDEACDLPAGTRLDVRVQMPEDSIWNQKQVVTPDPQQKHSVTSAVNK
ncbi:hypothetical protein [Xenorhabdus bovienii]|uniref:phage tail fiber protein n=1 Tax=Xenorhabdus bovienii TaxID=40576 RepID=UPI0023B2459C|nr:hypothetical protein [Xenorhabdus bovienii]MDE9542252.1 hypothetical protein [Xenorhabdus bovienii]